MKLLLAVDGSAFSNAAVESVAKRPWPAGSELKIISVMEPFQPYMTEVWSLPADFWEEMDKSAKQQANEALDRAVQAIKSLESDLSVTTEIIKGNPKSVIVDEAEKWEADLIVLGSHGYTGLKRMFLGSVSQAVASHAKCSVEIVRTPETAAA
jgi:nucleotide-binding universal stress UspA family protein